MSLSLPGETVLLHDDEFLHADDWSARESRAPRLQWSKLSSAGGYYAALVSGRDRPRTQRHTHDFFELMYVLAGTGSHEVNRRLLSLQAGDLVLIRPDDHHAISAHARSQLLFVNIAFPADLFARFCSLAEMPSFAQVDPLVRPPALLVPPERRDECAAVFHRALRAFYEVPSRLELCGFWSRTLPLLLPAADAGADADQTLPSWLRNACRTMRNEENLRVGLERLVELSGVSPAHLSRVLRFHLHRTPTDFVNELRVERAALLLATTDREIATIAADAGFASLSYFYRLFVRRFGQSPHVFRRRARLAVAP